MRKVTTVLKIDKRYRPLVERAVQALHDEYASGNARYIQTMTIRPLESGQEISIAIENAPAGMQLAMYHFCKGFVAGFRAGAHVGP